MNSATLIFSDQTEIAISERSSQGAILIEEQSGEDLLSALQLFFEKDMKMHQNEFAQSFFELSCFRDAYPKADSSGGFIRFFFRHRRKM